MLAFLSGSLGCHIKTWPLKPWDWLEFSLFSLVLFVFSPLLCKDCICELETSLALLQNSLQGLMMDDWICWPVIHLSEWRGRDRADTSPLRTGLQAPNWFICPFLLIMKKGNGLVQIFYKDIWLRWTYLRENTPQPWLHYYFPKAIVLKSVYSNDASKTFFFLNNKRSSLDLADPDKL